MKHVQNMYVAFFKLKSNTSIDLHIKLRMGLS